MQPDNDDWQPEYPAHVVGWLYGIMRAFDFQYPPSVILDEDERYPGIWDELFYYVWQDRLVDQQHSSK